MSQLSPLQVTWKGDICHLLLDRPAQGNALSGDLVHALDLALDTATERGAELLVIEGAGRHFCTGFDLSSMNDETDDSLLARFTRIELLLQHLHRMPCPTVAVAHGMTMGAGADMFAACTHRLALDDSVFAFPGFTGFELVLGTRRLGSRVGANRALDWVGTGRLVNVTEALAAGLVTAQCDDADFWFKVYAIAKDVQPSPPPLTDALCGDDARDLRALILSAAKPGLRDRVNAYVQRRSRVRLSTSNVQSTIVPTTQS